MVSLSICWKGKSLVCCSRKIQTNGSVLTIQSSMSTKLYSGLWEEDKLKMHRIYEEFRI